MSSIYFPAHVVVLFRRLVNVVSTLSISNQYISHTSDTAPRPHNTGAANGSNSNETASDLSKPSSDYLRNISWPRWAYKGEDVEGARQISDYGMILKAAIELPQWIPGKWSWSSLSLSQQTEPTDYDHNIPPVLPPNFVPEDEPPRNEPPKFPTDVSYPPDVIHQLLANPALLDPVRTPRYPIVLCHGLYGFDSRGPSTFPSMRMHYWSNVLSVLRGIIGADVIVTSVPGTGSIYSRAAKLDEQLQQRARGRGINLLAHSMGGLDCRHLISHIRPQEYAPLSLTSISTPHRGSPFMDWCENNIGIGKLRQQEEELKQRNIEDLSSEIRREGDSSPKSKPSAAESSFTLSFSSLPSSFTTLLLSVVDSPAYANLTSNYLNDVFNPKTPDNPSVKYWSVAGRMSAERVSVWHPFWLPKMVLDGAEEKERERLKKMWEEEHRGGGTVDQIPFWADERQWGNDGLVTVQSAKWGEFLGTMEGCDHWEMRGARGIEFGVDIPAIPAIGLGSLPLASSLANLARVGSDNRASPTPHAQGDGWGFGDWTRFVGAWKKSKDQEAAAERAGNVHKHHKHSPEEAKAHDASMNIPHSPSSPASGSSSSSSSSLSADATASPHSSSEPPPGKAAPRRSEGEDHVLKMSTDTLSVVFDWLIERVPAPGAILGRSSTDFGKGKGKEREMNVENSADGSGVGSGVNKSTTTDTHALSYASAVADSDVDRRDLNAFAATYVAGHGRSRGSEHTASNPSNSSTRSTAPPSSPPSDMKRRMEKEDKGRRKQRELANKEDLQRFYVALARKMYDAGL